MPNARPAEASPPPHPGGFLTITLHAHLPYVVNHGTWPHGMEWLHEAAAETYLPLLRVLTRLQADGVGLHCNLNLSPVLMEQLVHPVFVAEFPNYLQRKIVFAREDEAFFAQSGEHHYAETARFWQRFFTQALEDFNNFQGNIIAAFQRFQQAGLIEIITCAATHGYLPLLGTDESVRAQVRTAVSTYQRHLGVAPRGIWSPECGYRPAGVWSFPVANADGTPTPPPCDRIGVEQAFAESHLGFFFVDTHLVEESEAIASPYRPIMREFPAKPHLEPTQAHPLRSLYQPYTVEGPYTAATPPLPAVSIFPRDPRTGLQVWSGDTGYPGDGNYVDFHKKRWPGGHRYWRVTGPRVEMNDKEPYFPQEAVNRVQSHANHFVQMVHEALEEARRQPGFDPAHPPVLSAPFDAELFGHWWFEGPLWLEAVARILHTSSSPASTPIQLISSSAYLEAHPHPSHIAMHEGSWGAEGNNQVWLNPETAWTYSHLYPAELYTREICTAGRWRESALATRIARQLCRELLLLESSDWQFLITTGAARDYAELRFLTHNDQFLEVKSIWQAWEHNPSLNEHQETRLAEIERRDSIFADLDPAHWALSAKAE